MVSAVPVKPIVLANFYLDTGTLHHSGAGITFKGTPFTTRIISTGTIERSIPLPSGQLQIPDAQITVADTDGVIKALIDDTTPIRRLVEIIPELASHKDDVTPNNPLFIGEILNYHCPPGEITINLKSITAAWLSRPILHLINRDSFPNIPDEFTTAFAPIIFGRCFGYFSTNVASHGAIQCIHVDTTTNDYVVARHPCFSIPTVYRKKYLDARFRIVDPSEYTTPIVDYEIGGVTYHFQMIRFNTQQYDGTIIQCDVSGSYTTIDWSSTTPIDGVEVRNPSDCLWNLIYIQLQNEVDIDRFDADSFIEVRNRCADRGYFCDGAITDKSNSLEVITCGSAISKLCESFGIDFLQTTTATIQIRLFDLTIDAPLSIPVDADILMERTLTPSSPTEIINHFRYKYFRDNAGLPEGIRAKGNQEYAFEYSIRNVTDQTELSATGANPDLKKIIELGFVRDDSVAIDVIKKRVPYHALRSYNVAFSLPAWTGGVFVGTNIDLGQACNLTSIWGIGASGFVDALARISVVTVDLKQWEIRYKAVVYWPTTDGDLDIEFTGHAAHAVQTRKPQFPVTVNGATVVTAPKGIDLGALPAAPGGFTNIIWQEDSSVEPRRVSGYYSATGGAAGVVIYFGTLEDPDERPTGLGVGDAAKVLFYSTDFDHMYIWNGADWTCIDYNAGTVSWHIFPPLSNGWVLCNGSGTVSITDPHGDVFPGFPVPNLTGGTYIRGGVAYSGPTPTNAIGAPVTGSSDGHDIPHTHLFTPSGSVIGDLPPHEHITAEGATTGSAKTAVGGDWVVIGTLSGETGFVNLGHAHGGSADFSGTGSGSTAGSFDTIQAIAPIEGFSTVTASAASHNHSVSTFDSGSGSVSTDEQLGVHAHDIGNIAFTDASPTHFHPINGQLSGPINEGPIAMSLTFDGTLDNTTQVSVLHSHGPGTYATTNVAEPKNMTLLPYLRL